MDLAYELHDLVRTLDRMAEKILRPHGLNVNRYVALVIISEHAGLTGRDLSGALGITEAAGSGIVRSLLTRGLIHDAAVTGSGNIRRLRLTDDGADVLRRCSLELGTSLDDNALAVGIDPTGLAATIRALHDEVRTYH
ncbi:MarR family winged helix-turn-helix transcriptional regulator [Paramicrobacterium chengjingii]|uniref:MarR family winged helix-turn-helix transcriptional regulator n=1 Tax=Paramicrobacterium chengjingii TaxID=2769067 RepID=UPI00141DEFF7|nr:winged helix DNA-binding protein [Microbacterium chengjingii]